jgi:restriction system protein
MDLNKEVLEVDEFPLEKWLELVFSKPEPSIIFIDYEFPNARLREEYLATIQDLSEENVKGLLRKFLIHSGKLGSDEFTLYSLIHSAKTDKKTFKSRMNFEYYRRLIRSLDGKTQPWEGITWILDLLPHNPRNAIDVIYAYLTAHAQFLPDGRLGGLVDATAIIRAKFIESPNSTDFLDKIDPYEFEHLVEALYTEMGYECFMTQKTHDGGKDLIATKNELGKKEKIIVECKKQRKTISVSLVRSVLGVVSDLKVSKGVIVTTTNFSPDSRKLAEQTGRLELINLSNFQQLMNEYFGAKWQFEIDRIISTSISRQSQKIIPIYKKINCTPNSLKVRAVPVKQQTRPNK